MAAVVVSDALPRDVVCCVMLCDVVWRLHVDEKNAADYSFAETMFKECVTCVVLCSQASTKRVQLRPLTERTTMHLDEKGASPCTTLPLMLRLTMMMMRMVSFDVLRFLM